MVFPQPVGLVGDNFSTVTPARAFDDDSMFQAKAFKSPLEVVEKTQKSKSLQESHKAFKDSQDYDDRIHN